MWQPSQLQTSPFFLLLSPPFSLLTVAPPSGVPSSSSPLLLPSFLILFSFPSTTKPPLLFFSKLPPSRQPLFPSPAIIVFAQNVSSTTYSLPFQGLFLTATTTVYSDQTSSSSQPYPGYPSSTTTHLLPSFFFLTATSHSRPKLPTSHLKSSSDKLPSISHFGSAKSTTTRRSYSPFDHHLLKPPLITLSSTRRSLLTSRPSSPTSHPKPSFFPHPLKLTTRHHSPFDPSCAPCLSIFSSIERKRKKKEKKNNGQRGEEGLP